MTLYKSTYFNSAFPLLSMFTDKDLFEQLAHINNIVVTVPKEYTEPVCNFIVYLIYYLCFFTSHYNYVNIILITQC